MVSVILPSYNHAPYLKERIDSILNQTFQDFELIILDDKSSDNSQEIINQYLGNKRISHIVYNEKNSGSTFIQWNKGINLAKGEYIWIAESDDFADPELLQTLYNKIINNPKCVLSYCQSNIVNEQSAVIGDCISFLKETIRPEFESDFSMQGEDFMQKYLIYSNVIPNASAVLFSKEAFLQVGGADSTIGFAGDWYVWLKMLPLGTVSFSSQKLNYYRRHDKSIVTSAIADNIAKKKLFLKKFDLNMRIAYQKWLFNKKEKTVLYQLNKDCIIDDCFVESRYLWVNKEYIQAIKYLFLCLKYSNYSFNVIKRGVKFVSH